MYVKPNQTKKVDGKKLKVFDPVHKDFLPDEGREVTNNTYWTRRLQANDIVLADSSISSTKTESKAKNASTPKQAKPKPAKSVTKKEKVALNAKKDTAINSDTHKTDKPVESEKKQAAIEEKGE